MFYVNEVTGTIVNKKSRPSWFWHGYESEFDAKCASIEVSKNAGNPLRALIILSKFILIILFFIIVLFIKCLKLAFPKKGTNASVVSRIVGMIGALIIIAGVGIGGNFVYKVFFAPTGYLVTKIPILEYESKIADPKNKQSGTISDDIVLKIKYVSKTENLTWIQVYKLIDNEAKETWILIPEKIDYMTENKYLQYNTTSKTWDKYYALIDSQNAELLKECKNEFLEGIKGIEIKHSTDMVEKESLKKTAFIFRESGYFGMWKSEGNDFYYISKDDKKVFMDQYNISNKKYKKNKSKQ